MDAARRCAAQNSSRRAVASAPAMTSEWPLRYFVAECMTISAPSASGRVSSGVATVESTASSAPARMRDRRGGGDVGDRHSGLAGVSIHTSRVAPGRIAA